MKWIRPGSVKSNGSILLDMCSGWRIDRAGIVAGVAAGVFVWLGLATHAAAQPPIAFSKDVAPILFEHCVTCHRPGEIAPFSLLTYEEARPQARAVARATRDRTMPPWKPEPGFGDFAGAHRLSEREIDTIQRWVESGAPEGERSALPTVPRLAQGWRLGQPDLVVTLPDPYVLAA